MVCARGECAAVEIADCRGLWRLPSAPCCVRGGTRRLRAAGALGLAAGHDFARSGSCIRPCLGPDHVHLPRALGPAGACSAVRRPRAGAGTQDGPGWQWPSSQPLVACLLPSSCPPHPLPGSAWEFLLPTGVRWLFTPLFPRGSSVFANWCSLFPGGVVPHPTLLCLTDQALAVPRTLGCIWLNSDDLG